MTTPRRRSLPGPPDPDGAPAAPRAPLWAPTPIVTSDGSATLWSPAYGESFRSRRGALSETRWVFLGSSGVAERLAAGEPTRVLEVGLGTATNLATTVAAAVAGGARLTYRAWEAAPLPAEAWAAIGLADLLPPGFGPAWFAWRRSWPDDRRPPAGATASSTAAPTVHAWERGPIRVEVVVADIGSEAARSAGDDDATLYDAIYHDPFSPAANPEAWTPAVLDWLARRLAPGGSLVTYSVRGEVRRALAAAGLEVRRIPGPPGGKRASLAARRPS